NRGGLKVNSAGNNVKLKSDENNFELNNAKVSLNKGYNKVVDLNIQDGKVKLTRDSGEETLDKNSLVKVKKEKVLKKETIARPEYPVSEYFISSENKKNIEFKWDPPDPKSEYTLEVKNVETSKTILLKKVKGNSYAATLPTGNYKWKLIPSDKKETIPPSSKFAVVSDRPISLNLPLPDKKYTYVKNSPSVLFRWGKEEFFRKYTLEVSDSSNFSNLVESKDSYADETLLNKLKPGKYYYRVKAKPILNGMKDKYSEVRSFEIIKAPKPNPVALISPIDKKEFFKTKNKGYQNTFVWKKGRDYDSFEILISKSKDFSDIVKKESVNTHYYYLKDELQPGNYYWKIRGKFENEYIDSNERSFYLAGSDRIKLIAPINDQELDFGNLEFSWVDIMPGSKYIVELSQDKNFKKKVQKITSEKNFLSIPSPSSGKFYWKVSVKDSDTRINLRNEVGEFTIKPEPLPDILFPKNKSKVDLTPVSEIQFKWKSLEDAISYNMEIYSFSKERKILIKKQLKENYFTISDLTLLKRGTYELVLQARLIKKGEQYLTRQVKSKFEITLSKVSTEEDVEFITPEEVFVE
ncbi:MAG: hypothetical protein KDK36_05170, partial [Leptospiraceae bacterium]|nr:hypothetical protein [Leptospiraceae bacterium]